MLTYIYYHFLETERERERLKEERDIILWIA